MSHQFEELHHRQRRLRWRILLWSFVRHVFVVRGHSRTIFTFTIFTIDDWEAIESKMSEFENPDMGNYEKLHRSGLEWNAWSRVSELIELLSTWENLCIGKVFGIGEHKFQGKHFPISCSLAEQFPVRSWREFIGKVFESSLRPAREFMILHWRVNVEVIETSHISASIYIHEQGQVEHVATQP